MNSASGNSLNKQRYQPNIIGSESLGTGFSCLDFNSSSMCACLLYIKVWESQGYK